MSLGIQREAHRGPWAGVFRTSQPPWDHAAATVPLAICIGLRKRGLGVRVPGRNWHWACQSASGRSRPGARGRRRRQATGRNWRALNLPECQWPQAPWGPRACHHPGVHTGVTGPRRAPAARCQRAPCACPLPGFCPGPFQKRAGARNLKRGGLWPMPPGAAAAAGRSPIGRVPGPGRGGRMIFFWKAYLPIENTHNGNRPS
jgi:hypothetical protein